MDYYKVRKCIREYLQKNNDKISERAEARVIRMSQKGYTAMMEHHTLTVKKLEEIAQILNKPVSYFFVTDEDQDTTEELAMKYFDCKDCIDKQKEIERLTDQLKDKNELLDFYRGKKEAPAEDSAQYRQSAK